MNITKRIAEAAVAALTVTGLVVATPAHADDKKDIRRYQVAFTLGQGLKLRTAPSTSAPEYGDGTYVLPEGASFSGECEQRGDLVTNPYGESTDLWMRTPGGYYVTEAFLNTGTNSAVGLPNCAEMDAKTRAEVKTKTVADYHRAGMKVVSLPNPGNTSTRFYFSKAETRAAADALNKAADSSSRANDVFCAAMGTILGVIIPNGAIGMVAGFSSDLMCSDFAGALTPKNFEKARGAATAAAAAGKCYEVRAHRASAKDDWTYDVYTVTDSAAFCG